MSVGRRIAWAVAALIGPLLAAAVAAPWLVDVEAYKPVLVQAVKDATGRELVIDGPMRLRMLPVPRVSELLRAALGSLAVQDLAVEDPPLEEIMRELFQSSAAARAEGAG